MEIVTFAKDEVDESFDRIDENGDRSISFEEFSTLMLAIDHTKPESALRASFASIDKDHDCRVSLAEFRAWCR
jgi:Ca2+-binding EF-hand superfamily protein